MARWRTVAASILIGLCGFGASTASADQADAIMNQYFAIWADNGRVTPQAVESLYAPRADYYGKSMTSDQIYADKRSFIRRWPDRHYEVVAGSLSRSCNPEKTRCRVSVILAWRTESDVRQTAARGWSRVALYLSRDGRALKIIRESGTLVSKVTDLARHRPG